jgi:predicted ester cyclase
MGATEDNKALVRRAYEGFNDGDIDVLDEVFAPGYTAHFPGTEPVVGRDSAKELVGAFMAAFPDLQFTIEDQIAEGDRCATRWSARGTHNGEFRGFPPKTHGIPPTGNHVSFSATDIYRIEDGQIVEEWNTLEQLDVMQQIGAIPAPPE